MGETLKRRFGPLPVWVWALIFVGILAAYLSYRNRKAAADAAAQQQASNNLSSNLGTVPVSNLTTMAQPMPIQMGDTFVSTTVPNTVNVSPTTVIRRGGWWPPSWSLQTAPPPAPSPAVNVTPPQTQTPAPQTLPGYGAGLGQLLAANPTLLSANTPGGANIPGITGYQVSYNGVPL